MTKPKPIIFCAEKARAILEGRKTETRMIVNAGNHKILRGAYFPGDWTPKYGAELDNHGVVVCKYQPGDTLYVREPWSRLYFVDTAGYTHYDRPMFYYAADGDPDITLLDPDGFEEDDQRIRWRPSVNMPREAARVFLQVKKVTVEKLQDITSAGAEAEGAKNEEWLAWQEEAGVCGLPTCTLREYFGHHIWNRSLRSKEAIERYGWDANPWVFVIEFEREV